MKIQNGVMSRSMSSPRSYSELLGDHMEIGELESWSCFLTENLEGNNSELPKD